MSVTDAIWNIQSGKTEVSPAMNEEILDKIKRQQNLNAEEGYRAPQNTQGIDRTQAFRPVARPSFIRAHARVS